MAEWIEIYNDLATKSPTVFGHVDVQVSNIIYDSNTGWAFVSGVR